jgi:CheY-like chemotaxis protein
LVSDIFLTRKQGTDSYLVVEDNVINQRVMSQQLARLGCAKVHTANHGLEADFLSTTTFCNGDVPLSIILLDVEMPIMDGLTCARKIRELEKMREITKHVPICGITANARTSQIDSCIEAGMDEVVVSDPSLWTLLLDSWFNADLL